MSFFKKLFGVGDRAASAVKAQAPIAYKGYAIIASPMADGGQFRVAGSISKESGNETKTHKFIRADGYADRDAALEATIRKARLIIDQSGDSIF